MSLLTKAKDAHHEARASARAATEARRERDRNPATRWEYRASRVGEDKQKGLTGSRRIEEIFNKLGSQGWELVAINMERAVFKREVVAISQAELEELADVMVSDG